MMSIGWHNVSIWLFFVALAGVRTVSPIEIADVCYGDLGCFSMKEPWFGPLRPLPPPQTPDAIDTQFILYTRQANTPFNITKRPEIDLGGSDFNSDRPTFFIIHGFITNSNTPGAIDMKNGFTQQYDCNVVMVDWGKGSNQINYLQVASNTRVVAAETVRFTKYLMEKKGLSLSRLHLVGHSLGAHIAGYVGKAIPDIARITGLDVAQPAFEGFPEQVRLYKTDADFVEGIHTNARPFIPLLGFGFIEPFGHSDFYINGGADQPGCILPNIPSANINSLTDFTALSLQVLKEWIFCHHIRAARLFTATLYNQKNCISWGHKANKLQVITSLASGGQLTQLLDLGKCDKHTCSALGMDATIYPATGVFIVKTSGDKPYCIAESKSDKRMAQYKKRPAAKI